VARLRADRGAIRLALGSPGGHRPGGRAGAGSNGNRDANAASRPDSHTAPGSNRAKNRRPAKAGSWAAIMCKTKTVSPEICVTPSTDTVPGVTDIAWPRTVRNSPETRLNAAWKTRTPAASGTAK